MRSFKVLAAIVLTVVVLTALLPLGAMAQEPEFLVPLTDPMAAFLESRAVAAQKGATAEFRKMEWVAFDAVNNKLYLSMSEINKGMSDDKGDIKLPQNDCGIVYEASLDKSYNITNFKPAIVGGPFNKEAKDGNKCAVDNISNPDSLYVDPQGMLWIGEDTSNHANNAIWRWDPKAKKLARYATMPAGAEATGVMITPQNDLFFSVQHPSGMSAYPFNRATVVVVNGFKTNESFTDIAAPKGDDIHTLKLAKGTYQVLARVGENIPQDIRGQRWGQINDANGDYMKMCNQPDGNIFLPTNEKGSEGYLYTNYECQPGGMGKMYIRQTGKEWQVMEGENVDFSGVMGTWNNCGTSHTPWGTGLTAEEYEPFATKADWKKNVAPMTDYFGGKDANPYHYGWLVEIYPDPLGDHLETQTVKQYALGRFSHEMAITMPDGKTIYHGDDGTGVVLFKSVLDESGKMGAATLYAAKVTQKADESLDLKWIELGKGNNDEIYEAITKVKLPQ